jgi:hypothetical protein
VVDGKQRFGGTYRFHLQGKIPNVYDKDNNIPGRHEMKGQIRVASRGQKIVRVASRVVNPTVKGMNELCCRLLRARVRVASRGQFSSIKVVGKIEHL